MSPDGPRIIWHGDPTAIDSDQVGPKLASLIDVGRRFANVDRNRLKVPDGFVVTTSAYRELLGRSREGRQLAGLLVDFESGALTVSQLSTAARELVLQMRLPSSLANDISRAAHRLTSGSPRGSGAHLALRSSALAEDRPGATFAGQYDSVIGVVGHEAVHKAYLRVIASLFSVRALSYSIAAGVDLTGVAMAVGVQLQVRSDVGVAGVAISSLPARSSDRSATASDSAGSKEVVTLVDAAAGLGESVVGGLHDPESHSIRFDAPSGPQGPRAGGNRGIRVETHNLGGPRPGGRVLDDDQVLRIAWLARDLEAGLGHPIEVEWAIDGITSELMVVQVRPFLGHLDQVVTDASQQARLRTEAASLDLLTTGLSVGSALVGGVAQVMTDPFDESFTAGHVLVTQTTSPEWVPLMRRAGALITDHGGRTSHAAIVCRELGLAAVVGCGDATVLLSGGAVGAEVGTSRPAASEIHRVVLAAHDGARGFVYG